MKKLSTSGWDIPTSTAGCITTGFSGTNDNRFLLPLSIQQQDLPELRHTNGMVLSVLLRPENREYKCAADDDGTILSVKGLLRLISAEDPSEPIHVLIDVGAQILEMDNRSLAEEWLKLVPDADAALYFDENDEAIILEPGRRTCRLVASPFRDKLDNVLIYLDEVHTRGIDLAIPLGARAAVTLGPRLSKDRLVQACMRLRKLGRGHSLKFFASPEVHRSILDAVGKSSHQSLSSADVVQWAIEQTCQIAQNTQPLWVAQGADFVKRSRHCENLLDGWDGSKAALDGKRINTFLESIQELEARSLRSMYGADSRAATRETSRMVDIPEHPYTKYLKEVWESLDSTFASDSAINEEQERELAPEVERERQVQRAPPASARRHEVHNDVRSFVSSGIVPASSGAIQFAFHSLQFTPAGQLPELKYLCPQLRVTTDFINTVQLTKKSQTGDVLRPVRWVLASINKDMLLIISPFEANELWYDIKGSASVKLHVYAPRTTKTMVDLTALDFYCVNSILPGTMPSSQALRALNLFAGCLYLRDEAHYKDLCNFLGIVTKCPSTGYDNGKISISSDGFADPVTRKALGWPVESPFTQDPLPFLRTLISLRTYGQSYAHTHMGFITNGRVLRQDAFPFERQETTDAQVIDVSLDGKET